MKLKSSSSLVQNAKEVLEDTPIVKTKMVGASVLETKGFRVELTFCRFFWEMLKSSLSDCSDLEQGRFFFFGRGRFGAFGF